MDCKYDRGPVFETGQVISPIAILRDGIGLSTIGK